MDTQFIESLKWVLENRDLGDLQVYLSKNILLHYVDSDMVKDKEGWNTNIIEKINLSITYLGESFYLSFKKEEDGTFFNSYGETFSEEDLLDIIESKLVKDFQKHLNLIWKAIEINSKNEEDDSNECFIQHFDPSC